MKRFFAHLIVLMLFPQVIFAVILVPRPIKPFSLSQTYIVPKDQYCKSYIAPNVWSSSNGGGQNVAWNIENLQHHEVRNTPDMLTKRYCQHKHLANVRNLSVRAAHCSNRNLCQALH